MAKKLTLSDAKKLQPVDVIGVLQTGVQLVDAAQPIISVLFDKLTELFKGLGKKNPNSPANRLKRIEILEAQNLAQKELNKTLEARLAALESK